jgi:hypothetical protein
VALLVASPTALVFLTNISEKRHSVSHSAVQVKNWQKTISVEEKLDIIIQPETGE